MTHPPGPWKQIEYDDWLYIGGDDMDYVEYDPTNEPYNYAVINAVCVIDHIDNITKREEANATLIAAAPDLLAACKVALNAINLNDETLTAREHLQAAIAKATQP